MTYEVNREKQKVRKLKVKFSYLLEILEVDLTC